MLSYTKQESASAVIIAHPAPLTVGLSFPLVHRAESKLQTRPICVYIRCAPSISYSSQASQWPATEPGTIIVSQSWLTSCDATCQTLPPLSVLCCCRRRLHCFYFSLCVWAGGGGRSVAVCVLIQNKGLSSLQWVKLSLLLPNRLCLWFPSFCNINVVNLYYLYWLSGSFLKFFLSSIFCVLLYCLWKFINIW